MSSVSSLESAHPQSRRDWALDRLIDVVERGWAPDALIRFGIRRLCAQRLASTQATLPELLQELEQAHVDLLRRSDVAVHTADANRQHYELPPEFFDLVLGEHRKYSCGFWPTETATLAESEKAALDITIERAELADGQQILELGCGWGSLTLEMARRFPKARIVALSNSNSQRLYIEKKAQSEGLTNLRVLTADINQTHDLVTTFGLFDRVVSVEMFEHLRNYELLFQRISSWLKPDGKMFVHIFTHREISYLFDTEGSDNWMGRYFFTGGQMPSRYLFRSFQKDLTLARQWTWNGSHYARTSDAWLANLDRNRDQVMKIMDRTYGAGEAQRWFNRWRVFFLSCSELFAFAEGSEWFVSHYLFQKRSP